MKIAALGNILFLIAVFVIITLIPHEVEEDSFVTFKLSRHPVPEKLTKVSETLFESPDEIEFDSIKAFDHSIDHSENSFTEKTDSSSKPIEYGEVALAEKSASLNEINDFKDSMDKINDGFSKLDGQSGLTDEEYFKQFEKIYKATWVQGINPEFRKDVVIRYYVKEEDGDAVFSLRQLGYYIHERPTSERFSRLASNALYYGSQVNVEDIKMVAYSLISKGVNLKIIAPSQFSNDWKANSIEIGSDDTALENTEISLNKLRKFKLGSKLP